MNTRITTNPGQCGGKPCVRGMRIRVTDVLELLANGLSREQILDELPDLESEDITACIQYDVRTASFRSGWEDAQAGRIQTFDAEAFLQGLEWSEQS